jgi:hypothetical protein
LLALERWQARAAPSARPKPPELAKSLPICLAAPKIDVNGLIQAGW